MQVVYGQGLLFCIAIEVFSMSEIIFEVQEDEIDGGYVASALGYGIHTQGETLEELRSMVKDAVHCYFDETMPAPKIIRLHFVLDEVLV
jgi:predicted RNase H-like HicB family nuclease